MCFTRLYRGGVTLTVANQVSLREVASKMSISDGTDGFIKTTSSVMGVLQAFPLSYVLSMYSLSQP